MNQYSPQSGFNFKLTLSVAALFLLVAYGLFNARSLIFGPSIEIWSPARETETTLNTLTVKGRATNITFISLNERPISVDTEGVFEEKLLLSPGFNIIEVKVRDRFKNEVSETVRVYYKQ